MKTMKRWVALLLAVALLGALGACSSSDEAAAPNATPEISMADDLERLAGLTGDMVMVTVDGEPIYAEDYFYWLAYTVDYLEAMSQYAGNAEVDWELLVGDMTMEEAAKVDALSSAMMYRQLATKAVEMGCTITDEALADYQDSVALSIENMGGEDYYILNMRYAVTNASALDRNGETSLLYQVLAEMLYGEGGEQEPTAEEISAFAAENDYFKAKHILLSTVDLYGTWDTETGLLPALDDDVVAEKYALADDILAQLAASDEPLALFDEFMFEYSEDSGTASYPDGYEFGTGEMVTAFEDATRELEIGEISGIVESEYGIHIILRLDPDSEAVKNDWINYAMEELVSQWSDEAVVEYSEEYENIDVSAFYEALVALRADLELEFQAMEEAKLEEEAAAAEAEAEAETEAE